MDEQSNIERLVENNAETQNQEQLGAPSPKSSWGKGCGDRKILIIGGISGVTAALFGATLFFTEPKSGSVLLWVLGIGGAFFGLVCGVLAIIWVFRGMRS